MSQRQKNKNSFVLIALFLVVSFFWQKTFALESDRDAPLQLQADQAFCQQKENVCVYTGNVIFDQGSSHLAAPKLVIYQDGNAGINKIVATGTPASYHTITESKSKTTAPTPIDAIANTIEFYPLKSLVILLGNAKITQEKNTFQGEHIEYDMNKQTIYSAATKNSRTVIVVEPNK
jgi:lipopolysaccharide export system protein LptA